VTFSQSPEKRIGESIFTEVGKDLIIDFERGEVGWWSGLAGGLQSLQI
jgi:hypothetical protein